MDPNTRALIMGAAGAGGGEKIYVEDVFSTWLYTGTGATQTITNGIDLSGKGGLVWTKQRSQAVIHTLIDTARGAGNYLVSSSTQANNNVADAITAFNSTGYSLGSRSWLNGSLETHVSWTFRKAPKFFDVVTWTGNGAASRAIAHNLGSQPGFITCKRTDGTTSWPCAHRGNGTTGIVGMLLNDTGQGFSWSPYNTYITSTTFDPTQLSGSFNVNGATYVAYLFAHDAGGFGDSGNDSVVKCGSFVGTGPVGGQLESLGWEPQWLLIKRVDSTSDWEIYDSMRGFLNGSQVNSGDDARLRANLSNAEDSWYLGWPTSTGFQYDRTGTYIYIAIRRGPMKTPTDATKVYTAALVNSSASTQSVEAGFPVDLVIKDYRNVVNGAMWFDRIRGLNIPPNPRLMSSVTNAEGNTNDINGAYQTGVTEAGVGVGYTSVDWFFRRAPGFFDVVAYTGTGANRTVSHNLGVIPELMIVKNRTTATEWGVWSTPLGLDGRLQLNTTSASSVLSEYWSALPTASVFSVGVYAAVNQTSANFIAYLFASCPGVSKVFNYTGTGTTLQVNCGFTAGARFVMIKRTDSTGDWYVWDTARGIVSGNDPYVLMNSSAAEVTSTDYIDPYSAGFEISSTAPAAINASGGSFIFLAIA